MDKVKATSPTPVSFANRLRQLLRGCKRPRKYETHQIRVVLLELELPVEDINQLLLEIL